MHFGRPKSSILSLAFLCLSSSTMLAGVAQDQAISLTDWIPKDADPFQNFTTDEEFEALRYKAQKFLDSNSISGSLVIEDYVGKTATLVESHWGIAEDQFQDALACMGIETYFHLWGGLTAHEAKNRAAEILYMSTTSTKRYLADTIPAPDLPTEEIIGQVYVSYLIILLQIDNQYSDDFEKTYITRNLCDQAFPRPRTVILTPPED